MRLSLAEALENVELKPGKTYQCEVKGQRIEVRVLDNPAAWISSTHLEEDGKIDAWCDLPTPKGLVRRTVKLGKLPLPDPPIIPEEDENL